MPMGLGDEPEGIASQTPLAVVGGDQSWHCLIAL